MRKIFLFILILFISSSLQAYSKKIVLAAFSNKQNANRGLNVFKKSSVYTKLDVLAKENDFKVYVRSSGKFYVIIIEPIKVRSIGIEVFELVREKYKNAYTLVYTEEKAVEVEKKTALKQVTLKKNIPKKVKPKKIILKKVLPKIIEKKESFKIKKEDLESKILVQEINKTKTVEKKIKIQDEIKEKKIVPKKTQIDKKSSTNIIKNTEDSSISIWSIVKYLIIILILAILTYYYVKFKRIYDEY